MNYSIEEYIAKYKQEKDIGKEVVIGNFYFAYTEKLANELGELVSKGIKRGTTSGYWGYDAAKDTVPKVGDLNVITDFYKNPLCIIEIKKITIKKFSQISKLDAYTEGEGNKSLRYWKKVHKVFFSKELQEYGLKFNRHMLVVFEEFDVFHRN